MTFNEKDLKTFVIGIAVVVISFQINKTDFSVIAKRASDRIATFSVAIQKYTPGYKKRWAEFDETLARVEEIRTLMQELNRTCN